MGYPTEPNVAGGTGPEPASRYRAEIDGLRALAVLAVLAYHAFPEVFPGGFSGVDVFFVISGFLISSLVARDHARGTFSFLGFYARRARRILPSLLAVVFACLAFGWFTMLAREYSVLGRHAAASAASLANLVFLREVGYFDTAAAAKPLLHLWSLGVEEQFYLLWPALLVLSLWLRRPWGAALLSASAAASLASAIFSGDAAAFYLPTSRLWEFASGALLAWAPVVGGVGRLSALARYRTPAGVAGLVLIVASAFASADTPPLSVAAIAALGAVLVVAAGESGPAAKLLRLPALTWVGRVSYPLYLWHWPILSFAYVIRSGGETSALARVGLLLASLALAAATHRFVEEPARRARGWRSLALVLAATVAVAAAGVAVWQLRGIPSRLPAEESMDHTRNRGRRLHEDCVQRFGVDGKNDYCLIAGDGPGHVFFTGDSTVEGVFYAYRDALAARGYTAFNLGTGGCPFLVPEADIEGSGVTDRLASVVRSCNEANERYLAAALETDLRAVVIAHDAWMDKRPLFVSGMEETLSRVPRGVPVFWFLRNPRPPENFLACAGRPLAAPVGGEGCPFDGSRPDEAAYRKDVEAVLRAFPNVVTVDPAEAFCADGVCLAMAEGAFSFNDRRHLSLIGSKRLASALSFESIFGSWLPDVSAERR